MEVAHACLCMLPPPARPHHHHPHTTALPHSGALGLPYLANYLPSGRADYLPHRTHCLPPPYHTPLLEHSTPPGRKSWMAEGQGAEGACLLVSEALLRDYMGP